MPQRKSLPHSVPRWVGSDANFFITLCCRRRGKNQLCSPQTAATVFEAVQFRQNAGAWYAHLVVLMPDHLHALVSFSREVAMKKTVSNFKEFVAKQCGIQWQRDFFDHRLRADESYDEKASYIRMNPVRQQLVATPEAWPYVWEPR
jgi:putative transposase